MKSQLLLLALFGLGHALGKFKYPVASPVWAGTKPFGSQPSQAELLPGTGCHFVVPEKRTLLMPRIEVHTYCPAWSSWCVVIKTNNEMSISLEFGCEEWLSAKL